MRKIISLCLTICLLLTAVMPVSAYTNEANSPVISLDFEEEYTYSDGKAYYSATEAENITSNNTRGSHAEIITEVDGNTAVRLTYDDASNNENYAANPALNIFDTSSHSKFIGEAGKKYVIEFSYKVENTGGKVLELYIAACNRSYGNPYNQCAFQTTNLQLDHTTAMNTQNIQVVNAVSEITATSSSYVSAKAVYTANGTDYPIIALVTNDKVTDTSAVSYASVLIDNISVYEYVEPEIFTDFILDFEEQYTDLNGSVYYSASNSKNWTNDSTRSSHAEIAQENDGNTALRLTYKAGRNVNYKDNPAINIFAIDTGSRFVGEAGKTYFISLSLKIENTDSNNLKLYLVNCGRFAQGLGLNGTDCNLNNSAMKATDFSYKQMGETFTEETNGYVKVHARFNANGSDSPIIVLSVNDSVTVEGHSNENFASVLIDNLKVEEDKEHSVTVYNYDGSDKEISVFKSTAFSELSEPTRSGYFFDGWYTDENLTKKAEGNELVSNYKAIYVKWLGDGTAMTPTGITDSIVIGEMKGLAKPTSTVLSKTTCVQNSILEQAASNVLIEDIWWSWYGSYVISSDETVSNSTEAICFDNIRLNIEPAGHSVLFYVEVPDYEKAGQAWGMALHEETLVVYQSPNWCWIDLKTEGNKFYYIQNNAWVESSITKDTGVFEIPSGYKGYIKIDFEKLNYRNTVDLTKAYMFNAIYLKFNGVGGECGNAVFGGIVYSATNESDKTVMTVSDIPYALEGNKGSIAVVPYDAYAEEGSTFSTRYSGTVGNVTAQYRKGETSAYWGKAPAVITTSTGKAVSSKGYMNTYTRTGLDMKLQPGSDTFMVYVEIPKHSSNECSIKLLDTILTQNGTKVSVNFSNSVYKYMSVESGVWKTARAGADGELYAIESNFKGYIKFDIKKFKGFVKMSGIDLKAPYSVDTVTLGINNMGGENGDIVVGSLYSVLANTDSCVLKHAYTGETLNAKIMPGDIDMNEELDTQDLASMKLALAGALELDAHQKLRADSISGNEEFNTSGLATLKLVLAGDMNLEDKVDNSDGADYKDIFTSDVTTTNTATVYQRKPVTEYQAIIEADTALNSQQNAIDFANEINSSKVADFEKTGIDKMCHVSTFIYANGNIYVSYYANTVSAAENPSYQVARLSYCPEDKPNEKVILDIQLVGDDLYGKRVTGVYDTILMQKEGDNTNLYILWTASIEGKYYRLYRIFNMETETLGEICVNKFKVGDVVNDFSTTGIQNALTANNIGYKTMFSDIGIMQKLSCRVENGETYYYTGAYSGNFTCIIKSKDLITWEYVAQPNEGANGTGFENETKWENAVYVLDDKVYYFVRQWDPVYSDGVLTEGSPYGILTYYDLLTGEWATPVLVGDCQSRSDFIMYDGQLYLFYAPTDRNHIGILKIDTENLKNTSVVLQADMKGSCFYPFIQYTSDGELAMSYTVNRRYIRLAKFTLSDYL